MRGPFLFNILSDRLKTSLYHRRYYPVPTCWYDLFKEAPLKYAPGITMELIPTDVMHGCIAFTGAYELPLTRRITELGRQGGTMIDVGANAGYFSLLWAAANPANRCIAFEASPRNVDLITKNIRRNKFGDRIQLQAVAAGQSAGKMEFDVGPADQTGWGGIVADRTASSVPVDVVRIDEVVTSSDPIALLKIDVEGADTWVLMGCERLLRAKQVKEIHFEQNKDRLRALGIQDNAALEFLDSVGYKATALGDASASVVDWQATPK